MDPLPSPKPKPDPAAKAAQAWAASLNMPEEIGGYRIQRVLGSGGMATVFAALQKQPRRTVALKVMKSGVTSDAAFRRFKREIEILGKLHHPYIAQVYDAGVHRSPTGESVPYFVMEYISGAKTILEHIASKELDGRERLKLFVKVCAAVEHGHRNKVIHRDLKPGNILIDQFGEPKVIDFGVAHAADLDVSSQTMHTEAGRLVGTLQYMSPEQVDTKLIDLDARCDVYALGVILYKMLTGKPPHDLEALPLYEAARIIREESPPPPGGLKPELRGDLETIILKAMERDRTRRYHNAGSLGRDVVRFLAGKPIHARRASLLYRASLFLRRHRAAAIVAAAMICVLGASVAMVMIERQRSSERLLSLGRRESAAPSGETPAAAAPAAKQSFEAFALKSHTGAVTKLSLLGVPKPAQARDAETPPRLASASMDHSVIIWDLKSRGPLAVVREFDGVVRHLAASDDGAVVAASTDDGPVLVIDANNGKVLRTIRAEGNGVTSLALSPSGSRLAIGGRDLNLRIVPAQTRPETEKPYSCLLRSTTGAFTAMSFGQDEEHVAAGTERGNVLLWRLPLRQPAKEEGVANPAEPVEHWNELKTPVCGLDVNIGNDGICWVTAVADNGAAFAHSHMMPGSGFTEGTGWTGTFNLGLKSVTCVAFDRPWLHLVAFGAGQATHQVRTHEGMRTMTDLNVPEEPPTAAAIDFAGRTLIFGQSGGDIRVVPLPEGNR